MENNDKEKDIKSSENAFFTRGCSKQPEPIEGDKSAYSQSCCILNTQDWMEKLDTKHKEDAYDYVEVKFKNNHKEFFHRPENIILEQGDIVAVEASSGHDIGIVTLTGLAVILQLKKKNVFPDKTPLKKIYRRAKSSDIEKWIESTTKEKDTMYTTRSIAVDLKLNMKINDVEYQGDGTRAVFYYTAEDRVDFRELIKKLAYEFKVRIEMKQIGVRQESAKLGGIGSCGRELCCASWMTNFKSVSTNVAHIQNVSMNPNKLAGQCSKLKCCLNFEIDNYVDALKNIPNSNIKLISKKGSAFHRKTEILKQEMAYSYEDKPEEMFVLPVKLVHKIMEMNRRKIYPDNFEGFIHTVEKKDEGFGNVVGQDDVKRFDKKRK